MMKSLGWLVVSLGSLLSVSGMACPNLAGTYQCREIRDTGEVNLEEVRHLRISQSTNASRVMVYRIDVPGTDQIYADLQGSGEWKNLPDLALLRATQHQRVSCTSDGISIEVEARSAQQAVLFADRVDISFRSGVLSHHHTQTGLNGTIDVLTECTRVPRPSRNRR